MTDHEHDNETFQSYNPSPLYVDVLYHASAAKFTRQQGYDNIICHCRTTSGHCRTTLARMLSGDTFRSDIRRGLANADVDHDNKASIG